MRTQAAPALIGGPYAYPPHRVGDYLPSLSRGVELVAGLTDDSVPWPYARSLNGARRLILIGDLVYAVQYESVKAIMYHWGVGRSTVQDWRRLLGVHQLNAGTLAEWHRLDWERSR